MTDLAGKLKRTLPKSLLGDLNKPTLHALSYSLRHPDTWPEGFCWDFGDCDQCAIGLACELWFSRFPELDEAASFMAKKFAMPYGRAEHIFLTSKWAPPQIEKHLFGLIETKKEARYSSITPEMVADQIDAYLATAE